MRLAVIGHVEHITLGRVPELPGRGGIAHLTDLVVFPGGGGGMAFAQLVKSPAEVHLFTALGRDDGADTVSAALAATGATVHAARRDAMHTRDIVLITPDSERTIVVVGEPLHVEASDPLPWNILASCDGAYFTGQDPAVLQAARAARVLVVTARRRPVLIASGVRADVVVGSATDPREASSLDDYPVRPGALVLTQGAAGGVVHTADGTHAFPAPPQPPVVASTYGAGDSFAGALTYFLAAGLPVMEACVRAGPHGAAVLTGIHPLEQQKPLPALGAG